MRINNTHTSGNKFQSFLTVIIFSAIILIFGYCQSKKIQRAGKLTLKIDVQNQTPSSRAHAMLTLRKDQLVQFVPNVDLNRLVVLEKDVEIPSQVIDDKLAFMVDHIGPSTKKEFVLEINENHVDRVYPKKTQAELSVKKGGKFENRKYIGGVFENIDYLRVPDEHTDHSFYIRYEGPGWESELIGYRFYLDWRNAIDIFGKKSKNVILDQVGLDGFDSYHEMQPWGMDVLNVGNSLGIGSLGTFYNGKAIRIDKTDSVICQVLENGPIYSAIKTSYYGWDVAANQFDIESILSIHAGTRLTHHEIIVSSNPENLCTGIRKENNARLFTDQGNKDQWGYLATYGVQSLNNDKLGLAVFFSNKHFKGFTEDEYSNIVKLIPISGRLDYYLMGAWEGEENGIKNEEEFMNYIKQTTKELAVPITVSIKN